MCPAEKTKVRNVSVMLCIVELCKYKMHDELDRLYEAQPRSKSPGED